MSGKRGGAMSDSAAVEEVPVWLQVNGRDAVTWMCTPELLEELAVGWLHGEGYVDRADEVKLRPCATDLGFWAEVSPERAAAVAAERRTPVLASGCGAVSTFLADPAAIIPAPPRGTAPPVETMRLLFKTLFARGERYRDTQLVVGQREGRPARRGAAAHSGHVRSNATHGTRIPVAVA